MSKCRKYCEKDPMFAEGSVCDEFNKKFDDEVTTIADHIRAMTDEELVDFLWQFNDDSFENVMPFCKNTVECDEKVDSDDISTEMCKRCLLDKLRQPYESPTGQKG